MNTIQGTSVTEFINNLCEKQKNRIMPFSLTFELTPLCNFRCKMCYIRLDKDQLCSSGDILSDDEWIRIAKEAQKAGVYKITFTGGEVFSHPSFQKIYETVYDMGFHISIISNGSLIDEKALLWLCKRKPDFIKITIYGASNKTYQKVCGIENGFSRVTSNIKKLLEKGISVVTCMTVIGDNEPDIEYVKEWTKSQNLQFIYSKLIRRHVGDAQSKPEDVRLSFDTDDYQETSEIEHVADLFKIESNTPFENCIGYHNSCIIGWNGIIKGCNFINSATVDIRGNDLVSCFKELWTKLDNIRRPAKCLNCKYLRFCSPCPGKLEGESGNPEETSEYVCSLAKWCYHNLNMGKAPEFLEDRKYCE